MGFKLLCNSFIKNNSALKNKKYYFDFQELKLRISDLNVLDENNIEDINNKINSNKQLAFINHIYGKILFEKGKYKEARLIYGSVRRTGDSNWGSYS